MQRFFYALVFVSICNGIYAQSGSKITGNFQSNVNFFVTDSAIGAFGTPQYDNQKFGTEAWLNLNYSNWGFDASVRFDMFGNSNLPNPTQSFTQQGIGRWYVRKPVGNFDFSGGYIYDQIGTGIIFRAYEERTLAIDNALEGVRVGYKINENWSARAFTGRQKFRFDTYGSVMRGGVIEGFVKPDSASSLSFAPGFGVVARTFDEETINNVVSALSATPQIDREGVQYNTYAATIFNRLNYKDISWYVEVAGKTKDVMYNPFAERFTGDLGRLTNRDGYVAYSALTYAAHGLGITLENKYTKDFNFRTSPFEQGFRGTINLLPPVVRNNTYRLTTRYVPATQEFAEFGNQLDVRYRLNKKWQLGFNTSYITNLDTILYREIQPMITYKHGRKWQLITGLQLQTYNQWIYEGRNAIIETIVPFSELYYKLGKRRSLRMEAQYLYTKDDFGSWAWGLAELGLSRNWTVWVSNMYKIKHKEGAVDSHGKPLKEDQLRLDGINYPTVGVVYTNKANRLSFAYVKQVEGINCAGGICRYEPTFHGVRLNISTAF